MNILRRYIQQTLRTNKQRTALSLLSLILATALLFSVTSLVLASYRSVNASVVQSSGNYHVEFKNGTQEFVNYLEHNLKVESLLKVQHLGLSPLNESFNEERTYLQVLGYSKEAFHDLGIVLTEGRLPENDTECVISEAIINEAKVAMDLQEERYFQLGYRVSEENRLDDEAPLALNERFVMENGTTMKIVGIISEPSMDVGKPYYSVLTLFNESNAYPMDLYLRYHDLRTINETTEELADIFADEYESYAYNEQLMALNIFSMTVSVDNHLLIFIGASIVLFLLVTILLVRSSFANTYINREKHLAILKSIGVTERQRQSMAFYEGFLILSLALPLGILLGVVLLQASVHTINQLLAAISVNAIQLSLQHEWIIAIGSVLFVLVVAILSVQHSAHKAMKKSVSSTLHSNDEVHNMQRSYLNLEKKGNIYLKLIGKHIRQNFKDYDIAFLSGVLIMTLGLMLSSGMAYFRESGYLDINEHNYDVQVKVENWTYPTTLMTQLKQMEASNTVLISEVIEAQCNDNENILDEYLQQYGEEGFVSLQLVSYDDRILKNYIEENSLMSRAEMNEMLEGGNIAILLGQVYNSAEQRFYDLSESDALNGILLENGSQLAMKIVESDVLITGLSSREMPQLIISRTLMNQLVEELKGIRTFMVHYQSNDSNRLARDLNLLVQGESVLDYDVVNANATLQQGKTITTLLQLLTYGYILCIALMMGFASMCAVSTNFEYRKYEFILYRIVGMRMKNVRRMLAAEYLLYFVSVFACALICSQLLNMFVYHTFFASIGLKFFVPRNMMLIMFGAGILIGMLLILFASYKVKHFSYHQGLKNEISLL